MTAFALAGPVSGAGAQTDLKKRAPKVDQALQGALRSGAETQDVIITVKPGYRGQMRQYLKDRGDTVLAEHPSIEALAGPIHSANLSALAARPEVESIALNSTVHAGDAAAPRKNEANKTTEYVSETTSTGPIFSTTLRETLGLPRVVSTNARSSTLTGSSVG